METKNQENGTPERSIEEIATEFNQSIPTPTQQQQPVGESNTRLPDPILEPELFSQAVQQESAALKQQLSQVSTRLNDYETKTQVEATKEAIEGAVNQVNEIVNQDKDLVESFLNIRYNKDKSFAKIWDNRDQNPAALKEALGVVARDMQNKFAVVRDPQVAEDQRAINEATRKHKHSVQTESTDDKLAKLSDAEFDIEWNKLAHNGGM